MINNNLTHAFEPIRKSIVNVSIKKDFVLWTVCFWQTGLWHPSFLWFRGIFHHYKTAFFILVPHGHPNRVKHFASLNTLPRITSNKNLGVPVFSQKGVNRKGQVGVNRSALSAYGTLRRMSSFPRLNKIAQMRPCLSAGLCLIVLWPPNPAIGRPLLHCLHERVSLGQTNENRGQGI